MISTLNFDDALDILKKYGIPVPIGKSEKIEPGMEAIIEMTRDPELGPILTFSLSGVFAVIKDVSTRVGPVSHDEAISMIKETEAYAIIKGDVGPIAGVIEKVSRLAMENEFIKAIEINPLYIYEHDALAVDVSIVVE